MATTFPDNPAPEARLVLDAVLLVVVGAVLVLVVGSGVGEVDVGSLRLVVDGGGVLCDVVLCVVAGVGVDDTVVGVRADVVVLGCVIDCSGMSVRVALVVGCSKPGTVTCTCLDAPPSAAVRVVGVAVDIDVADWPTALPQAASNRTVMPWPAAINAARRLG
jgi:hypothetical protein